LTQARLGLVVTLTSTIRREAISITTKTYTTAKNAVYWVRKSQEKTCRAWFLMNVRQLSPSRRGRQGNMYRRMVLGEWLTPSLTASSSEILSSLHSG
jgi:hypothetical protein